MGFLHLGTNHYRRPPIDPPGNFHINPSILGISAPFQGKDHFHLICDVYHGIGVHVFPIHILLLGGNSHLHHNTRIFPIDRNDYWRHPFLQGGGSVRAYPVFQVHSHRKCCIIISCHHPSKRTHSRYCQVHFDR